ncbi:MAG: outer membrane channel lipoprotein [Desulfuromonadia bacterium]
MKRTAIPSLLMLLSLLASPPPVVAEPAGEGGGQESVEMGGGFTTLEDFSSFVVGVGYRSLADTHAPWRSLPYAELESGAVATVTGSRIGEGGILDLILTYTSDQEYLLSLSADRAARYRLEGTLESYRRTVTPLDPRWDPFSLWTFSVRPEVLTGRDHAPLTLRQNEVTSRVKPFDYPFHIDLSARTYEKKGTSFLRFADVDFTDDPNTVYLGERSFDRRVTEVLGGIDTHLGYLDLVNTFQYMTFRDEIETPRDVSFVSRSRNGTPVRSAGILQHNEDPESRFWMNTTRLHTSISGGVVAAISWSFGERESQSTLTDIMVASRPQTSVNNLSADLSWQGSPSSQIALRYRREGVDNSAPSTVTRLAGAIDPVNGDSITVPPPIDYVKESLVGTLLWHPASRVTLKSEYRGEFMHREGTGGSWLETYVFTASHHEEKHQGSVSIQFTPLNRVRVRGEYAVTGVVHPFYATTPDSRHEVMVSASYDPSPRLGLLLDLRTARESADPNGPNRRGFERKIDSAEGAATISPTETITISASLSYLRERTDGDLAASVSGGTFPFSSSHGMTSRIYAMKGEWRFNPAATLSLGYTRTLGDIGFSTADDPVTVFSQPGSTGGIGAGASTRLVEQQITSTLDMGFSQTLSGSLSWQFARLFDRLDPTREGYAHLLTSMLTYRW